MPTGIARVERACRYAMVGGAASRTRTVRQRPARDNVEPTRTASSRSEAHASRITLPPVVEHRRLTRPSGPGDRQRDGGPTTDIDGHLSRRRFLRYAMVGGVAVPMYCIDGDRQRRDGRTIQMPADPDNLSDLWRSCTSRRSRCRRWSRTAPRRRSWSRWTTRWNADHYITSIQILNFDDPIVIKGKFYFTPANGEVYLGYADSSRRRRRPRCGSSRSAISTDAGPPAEGVKVAAGGC